VRLILTDDLQRSRGTVFLRAIFILPFLIWRARNRRRRSGGSV
jgi:hypothetical protein